MPKTSNKYAFDLFDPEQRFNIFDAIFSKKLIRICDITQKSSMGGQSGEERYKRIVTLIREVNKDLREKGQFDLYIGYPFVIGRLLGENFDIRAPLALFPVEIKRESDYIEICLDDKKDIIYNNNLILAHYKFNNINRPLPNNSIENLSVDTFIDDLIDYYKNEGINIKKSESILSKFQQYSANNFPKFTNGEMWLDQNVILGKFPICSSSIQKDFKDILQQNKINILASELLAGIDDKDYYSDSVFGDEDIHENDPPLTISEHQFSYIGDLNSSQENVITSIKNRNALVVQGPPGTGKSQTITSLITDFINNGSNILLVSEKKLH